MKKANKTTKLTTMGKIWRIALSIVVPIGGGVIISLFTRDTMEKFGMFNQPPLAPPAWLFPIAWTILYTLMGLASYYIWYHGHIKKTNQKANSKTKKSYKSTLVIYGIQLVFNFIWTPLFFSLGWYWFAFGWLIAMYILIVILMVKTFKISKPAFYMLIPYLLWCTFAAYLNCSIAILN